MISKNVIPDNDRRMEYIERLRESLVMEEYYKIKSEYPDMKALDRLTLATERVKAREE